MNTIKLKRRRNEPNMLDVMNGSISVGLIRETLTEGFRDMERDVLIGPLRQDVINYFSRQNG